MLPRSATSATASEDVEGQAPALRRRDELAPDLSLDGAPRAGVERLDVRVQLDQQCAERAVLGFELRNPYPLHRQKAFIVSGVVPSERIQNLEESPPWDEWDPDDDRWHYGWSDYAQTLEMEGEEIE